MDINAFQLIEQLDTAPKAGLIEFNIDGNEIYVEASDAHFEALTEQTLKVTGRSGYGTIATTNSTLYLDIEELKYIRHTTKAQA